MLSVMGGKLAPQCFHENDVTLPFAGLGAIQILCNDLEHNDALIAICDWNHSRMESTPAGRQIK